MIQSQKNFEFFHDFRDLTFLLRPDTLASHLPMLLRIYGKMNCCKTTAAKAVRRDNVVANALANVEISQSDIGRQWTGTFLDSF